MSEPVPGAFVLLARYCLLGSLLRGVYKRKCLFSPRPREKTSIEWYEHIYSAEVTCVHAGNVAFEGGLRTGPHFDSPPRVLIGCQRLQVMLYAGGQSS